MRSFAKILKDKPITNTVAYRGYVTHDIVEATERYRQSTGFDPTIVLARPDFDVVGELEILVRSRHAGANMLMVSHYCSPGDISDTGSVEEIYKVRSYCTTPAESSIKANDSEVTVHNKKTKKPEKLKSLCPHCGGRISDFDKLGYWYGWAFGIEPPYWRELRLYVFDRDGYVCQSCRKRFKSDFLVAHHIQPKEDGGIDGARNLQTLCMNCHQDDKPLFEDQHYGN